VLMPLSHLRGAAVQAAVLRGSTTPENLGKPQMYREDREGTVY